MALSPKVADKIKLETDALREALSQSGLYANKRSEADVEGAFTQLYLSIPDVMNAWCEKTPTLILIVSGGGGAGAALYHTALVDLDPSDDPLLFAIQDYEQRVLAASDDKTPLPKSVVLMGFMGECVRGAMGGSKKAARYLGAFLKFMFPDQTRFFLELSLGADYPTTVSIDGYFTDA